MAPQNNSYTFDAVTQLKDAGAIAASAAASVATVARVVDLGQAYVEAVTMLDVTALDIDAGNEIYTLIMQGSSTAAFSSFTQLAALSLGAASVIPGGGIVSTVGRYYLRWQNEQNGVVYRYVRLYTLAAGAGITTGIDYSAWIGKTGVDS